jgi:hypothetical protein
LRNPLIVGEVLSTLLDVLFTSKVKSRRPCQSTKRVRIPSRILAPTLIGIANVQERQSASYQEAVQTILLKVRTQNSHARLTLILSIKLCQNEAEASGGGPRKWTRPRAITKEVSSRSQSRQ